VTPAGRIADVLQTHPEIADRTARFLAGDLVEADVSDLAQIVFRVRDSKAQKELEKRADTLIPLLQADDPVGRRATRSDVYRRAMAIGLEQLESTYKVKRPRPLSR
jgi:hypothetical protein